MKNYKHDPELATIVVTPEFGTMLRLPNGDLLKGLIFTRVYDHMSEPTTVIAKLQVNLEPTEKPKETANSTLTK